MSKEFYVLRGGRVVYAPGHYDEESAVEVAKTEAKSHPHSTVYVVKVHASFSGLKTRRRAIRYSA